MAARVWLATAAMTDTTWSSSMVCDTYQTKITRLVATSSMATVTARESASPFRPPLMTSTVTE
jgi:hypothetical protein